MVRCCRRISNCRASSVAWEPDGSGFFYTRYPEGDQYHRTVHHHTLGDDAADDPVVWAQHPTPETWPTVAVRPMGAIVLVERVGWGRTDRPVARPPVGPGARCGVETDSAVWSFEDDRRWSACPRSTLRVDESCGSTSRPMISPRRPGRSSFPSVMPCVGGSAGSARGSRRPHTGSAIERSNLVARRRTSPSTVLGEFGAQLVGDRRPGRPLP